MTLSIMLFDAYADVLLSIITKLILPGLIKLNVIKMSILAPYSVTTYHYGIEDQW
jgi:hypothetical protein